MHGVRVDQFGSSSVLKPFKDETLPVPKDDEILIKVESAGVNPVETYIRSGGFPILPPLPWIPGRDCAGTIIKLGGKVDKKFKVGQRVYTTDTTTGAYASHTTAPQNHVHDLPDKLNYQQGAALGIPYYTAYNALFQRGQAKEGETVLIHGASGGVGTACIELAKARKLTVIGTAGTKEGLELIKKLGADHVFNHRDRNYMEKIKELKCNINIIVEMLANANLMADCDIAALGGRIMVVGNRGTIKFDSGLLMMKRLDIRGVILLMNTNEEWLEASEAMKEILASGRIGPVIGKQYPINDAAKAHDDIMNNSGSLGKLVLNL